MRQRLANAHNLRKDKKKKPVLHVENEFELLKTLYIFIETIFPHERYRVQLALIMQLAEITGNRPSALLTVCYQHIKVTLLPDPDSGKQLSQKKTLQQMLIILAGAGGDWVRWLSVWTLS